MGVLIGCLLIAVSLCFYTYIKMRSIGDIRFEDDIPSE